MASSCGGGQVEGDADCVWAGGHASARASGAGQASQRPIARGGERDRDHRDGPRPDRFHRNCLHLLARQKVDPFRPKLLLVDLDTKVLHLARKEGSHLPADFRLVGVRPHLQADARRHRCAALLPYVSGHHLLHPFQLMQLVGAGGEVILEVVGDAEGEGGRRLLEEGDHPQQNGNGDAERADRVGDRPAEPLHAG